MCKNLKKMVYSIIGFILISNQSLADGYRHHVEYQGRTLNYAYYVPASITAEPDALILVPGLNGQGEHMINSKWIALSDKTGRPIIAPSFVFVRRRRFSKK